MAVVSSCCEMFGLVLLTNATLLLVVSPRTNDYRHAGGSTTLENRWRKPDGGEDYVKSL
jgi:hypothetical protein